MPPVDNNTPRTRAIATEPLKSAPRVATVLTPMTAVTALAANSGASAGRAFTRDEADHSELSVRRYFTKLLISGGQGQKLRGGRWELMPVEQFFLSLNTKLQLVNPERQPCSQGVATVTAVFAGFIWD